MATLEASEERLSIAEMTPWAFWANPLAVGSTEEEALAMQRGELPRERYEELMVRARLAYNHLVTVAPAGRA